MLGFSVKTALCDKNMRSLWKRVTEKNVIELKMYTVKLTRAKLSANGGNFTRGLHLKKPHMQFTCHTCSLPVKTGKFTRVYAASTSRRIHADCLQLQVNLAEHNGYFTGNIAFGTHANLPATSMQNCLLLQAKIHAIGRQKHPQSQAKTCLVHRIRLPIVPFLSSNFRFKMFCVPF